MHGAQTDRSALKLWIWISAAASFAGWTLSLLHHLDIWGYLVAAAITTAFWHFTRKKAAEGRRTPGIWRTIQAALTSRQVLECGGPPPLFTRRFKRPLPLLFFTLGILVFISGLLYPPNNHMALTYRLPRVLHWLADGHWSWVHAPDPRINDRACDNEWLIAPILLFTHSDRALFLLNFIPFLLLPGLVFSTWTRLGARPRVAWHWMWLLPTGYVFLIQAASISNDAFPTVYGLTAVDFALRARGSRRFSDLAWSLISIALLTGSKGSNLPLMLPWAVAFIAALSRFSTTHSSRREEVLSTAKSGMRSAEESEPPHVGCYKKNAGVSQLVKALLELFKHRPIALLCILFISAAVSFLPTALLNLNYCRDWSGAKLETQGIAVKSPVVGIWGNGLLLLKNFVPPLFPKAKWWNEHALEILPQAVTKRMNASFERGYPTIGEIPTEEWAGIGFGVSVLLMVSIVAAPFCRQKKALEDGRIPTPNAFKPAGTASAPGNGASFLECAGLPALLLRILLLGAPWISLAAYAMTCGMVEAPRLIAPYYPLLLPSLLISWKQRILVRKRWWRALALGLAALALPVLIISPARPLWPAKRILSAAIVKHPNSQALTRALSVYTVFSGRSDPLANVRALLPQDLKVVGFAGTEDDMPISLWRPYFMRRVENVLLTDAPDNIRERGITYVVVSSLNLQHHGLELKDWLERVGAELVQSTTATVKVSDGPQPWYIVRLR